MKSREIFGGVMKYSLFIALISLQILSIYTAVINRSDETEFAVRIWKSALSINATVGLMGNLFAMDCLSKLMTGKQQNILTDLIERDSKEISVSYNGFIVVSLFLPITVISMYLYIRTNMHLFLICSYTLGIATSVSVLVRILALYVQNKRKSGKTFLSQLLNPIVIPSVICFFFLMVTNTKTVDFVYRNLLTPTSTVFRILALMIILCYIPAVTFCHYSNLYCITAFAFITKDSKKVQAELDAVDKKNTEHEASLRQIAEHLDEATSKVGFFKKIGLIIQFLSTHIRAYWKENVYAMSYLLLCGKLKITQRLGRLLDEDRIKTHMIRFCEITVVLELLALNILLFIYLEDNDPCSRFFELLSTVIIIPILLSSLSNLKINKAEKE